MNVPVQELHAGEEVLWIVIPAFAVMMVVDIIKRRKLRRNQTPEPPGEDPEDR